MERVRVFKGGKITIPILYRKKFGIKEGEELLFDIQDDQIVISSFKTTLERVRHKINQHCLSGISLVDQLIADRRVEAIKEDAEYE